VLDDVRTAIRNPHTALRYVHRTCTEHCVYRPLAAYLSVRHGGVTDHFSESWDVLVVLDACRYDAFAAVSDLEGDLEARLSPASATKEWYRELVAGEEFYDTVYVAANPRITPHEDRFHHVDHVWDWGWDEELKVTPPDVVTEAATAAYERFPDKRLVVHYMQPHRPYIGEFAREAVGIGTGDQPGRDRALGSDDADDWETPKDWLERGDVSRAAILAAYRENLELALSEVAALLETVDDRVVVTADHGETFHERGWPYPRRVNGHPSGIPARKLRQVPWLVIEGDSRRETTAEPPSSDATFDDDHVSERLRNLGYLDA